MLLKPVSFMKAKAAASGITNPLDHEPDLVRWWTADQGITLNIGVVGWADQTTAAEDLGQISDSSKEPAYTSGPPAYLTFDATNDTLVDDDLDNLITNMNSAWGVQATIMLLANGPDITNTWLGDCLIRDQSDWWGAFFDINVLRCYLFDTADKHVDLTLTLSTLHRIAWWRDGTAIRASLDDGAVQGPVTVGNLGGNPGFLNVGHPSNPANMRVYDLTIYDTVLTAQKITEYYDWSVDKFGA